MASLGSVEIRQTGGRRSEPLALPGGSPSPCGCWYAVYTRARHEKQVSLQLTARAVESFLPLYECVRQWKDRRVVVALPLFAGYVFVRLDLARRMQVLTTHGVVHLVGVHGQPSPVPDEEIESLRTCLARRINIEPHKYLASGERVLVMKGPLAGVEGIFLRRKNRCRIVLSINLIRSSVSVEVDENDVQPTTRRLIA